MWKVLPMLCFLFLKTAADNLCNTLCFCQDSDEQAGMLTVLCINKGITSIPLESRWPKNTYTMDVSRNNITALESLEHQETIQILKINYCQLQSVMPNVFSAYLSLRQLDISQNLLSVLDRDTFLGIERLKVLNMSDNNVRKLPDNIFDNLVELEELKLSGNPLRYLETNTFKQLDNLIRLDISNIGAHTLNDGIFHFTSNLQTLDLSRNEFEEVPASALKSAPKLENLYFNENKIKTIDENSFKDLTRLKVLQLNEISSLRTVEQRAFSALKSLEELKMTSNSRLNHINPSAFDGIYNPADINSLQLKVLSLRNNDLPALDAYILPWCQIKTLDIQGNPWFCDCSMRWIINCSFPAELSTDLKCYGPTTLNGRSLIQLDEEQYTCLHEMAPNRYSPKQIRTIAAITGLILALFVAIVAFLIVKRKSIKAWWFSRRRGQGAVYYVKAQTNPTDNADF